MASEVTKGTQAASIGTEHSLTTQTSTATYVLMVDVSNMADGDILELRGKAKAKSEDGSVKLVYMATLENAQAFPVVVSIPLLATNIEFSLKQTAGTGRSYGWSLLSA